MKKAKKTLPQEKRIQYRLISINVVENYTNENYTTNDVEEKQKLNYVNNISFVISPAKELITVSNKFVLWIGEVETGIKIIQFETSTNYLVKGLVNVLRPVDKDTHVLPNELAKELAEISLAQARGVHAYLLKGNSLDRLYIPYENLSSFKQIPNAKSPETA